MHVPPIYSQGTEEPRLRAQLEQSPVQQREVEAAVSEARIARSQAAAQRPARFILTATAADLATASPIEEGLTC